VATGLPCLEMVKVGSDSCSWFSARGITKRNSWVFDGFMLKNRIFLKKEYSIIIDIFDFYCKIDN